MFHVELQDNLYKCSMVGKVRSHVSPITDMASSNTKHGKVGTGHNHQYSLSISPWVVQMLASGDSSGIVTIWSLDEENNTLVQMVRMEDWAGFPVTTLCIWNKYKEVCIV